jgi:ADP-heptose:LPS heptosyltransferase
MRVVGLRTDRIGDVILTLPALKALSAAGHEVSAVVAPLTHPLVAGQPFLREAFAWSPSEPAAGLIAWLRERRFDAAIAFHPRPSVAWALARAGVPVRVGTAYRWHSFLFTRRVRVHRSAQDRHEAEFSLDLAAALEPAVNREIALAPPARIPAPPPGLPPRYAVIHPTGGGSALNASPGAWADVARRIEAGGLPVVVTGSPADRTVATAVGRFVETAALPDLAAVLHGAAVVVGPSTGPLHLAAALGRPVVALHSPVRSQSPVRWRPHAPTARVILPHEAVCPSCLGEACPVWNCVDRVSPARVAAAALEAAA